jgi:hypothetical protein
VLTFIPAFPIAFLYLVLPVLMMRNYHIPWHQTGVQQVTDTILSDAISIIVYPPNFLFLSKAQIY